MDCSTYFSCSSISVRYEKVQALSDVSISMEKGEVIALIGANGAGKTTTLRAITGLARLAHGEIWFEGERIDKLRTPQIVNRGIGMVPEGRQIYPFMSVKDNLLMGAYLLTDGIAVRSGLDRVFDLFPRLRERYNQQGGTLSGGEQEMLAIGRALMGRPKLLLLDEPSLGLAPMVVREIAQLIAILNKESGVSVILVEQNSRMALKVSKHAFVLEIGRIGLSGPSSELAKNDHVRRLYLGG
jgi:branched-chain amino acid transport system ATP-binding protein